MARGDLMEPYVAWNGHTMQNYEGRSSAYAWCVDDCPACNAGEERPDW